MEEIGTATRLQSNDKKKKYQPRPVIQTIRPLIQSARIEDEEIVTARPIWKILTHRIGLIIAVAIGVTAGVGAWTFQQTPKYSGKFQLLVEPGQDNIQLGKLPQEGGNGNEVEYYTQIEVLRSPKLLKPIFQKISPRYKDLDYKALAQQQGTKEEPLKITRLEKTKIVEISYEDENPKKILFVLNNLADAYLKYGLETRQAELEQGIEFVNTQLPKLQQRVAKYEENLQKLRQKYNFIYPEQQANQLSKLLVDLETQFFETQVRLKETTSLYQSLQKQIGLNTEQALTSSYLSESPRYQHLLNQLQQVEIELAKESTIFIEDSPIIETLKEKRDNLQSLLKQEAGKILGNNSSEQINQPTQLDSPSSVRLALNQQLVQSANQIEVLQTRSSALEKQIQNLKTQIQQIPAIARQYTDIQRQINVASESLSRFLDAQEKIQIQAAQKVSPWELISPPELLKDSIYPNPTKNLSLGMIAGILLGVLAAFVAEKLDNKFHSPEELKEVTRLPILGYIPFEKNLHRMKPSQELKLLSSNCESHQRKQHQSFEHLSAFLEACMSMYANIHLLQCPTSSDNVPLSGVLQSTQSLKSIVISSATTAEGKSTLAFYLAQVASMMGQRVLLVETDLRYSQYYQWINVPYQQGLTDVVTMGTDVTTAIQKVPQWDNLSVLMAGNIPSNPTRLLACERMQQIIAQLHQDSQYDLVIYDSPPILSFTDAKILGASTQGIILITKMGTTTRKAFKDCINELKMSKIPLLGLVANRVSRRHQNLT